MLLGRAGYEAWVFDLREFLPDRYEITVRVKEYVAGRDQGRDAVFHLGDNKLQLSDLPEEARDGIRRGFRPPDDGLRPASAPPARNYDPRPGGPHVLQLPHAALPSGGASRCGAFRAAALLRLGMVRRAERTDALLR